MEIIQKLSGKSTFFGMNSDQLVLGMLTRPDIWSDLKVIKIKTPKLKKFLVLMKMKNILRFQKYSKMENIYFQVKQKQLYK